MIKYNELSEETSKKLGEYIEKLRIESNLGFNQLAIKSGLNVKTLNEIINGKSKRANPFNLQRLGYALRIDYKDLYKIVGYLTDDDFNDIWRIKIELDEANTKLKECEEKLLIERAKPKGHTVIGNSNITGHCGNSSCDTSYIALSDEDRKKVQIFIDTFINKKVL